MTEVLIRADNLNINEVADGYVIYQGARDRVHYLNKTAAIVFELCDGGLGIDNIIRSVADLFKLEDTHDEEIRNCIELFAKGGAGFIAFNVIAVHYPAACRKPIAAMATSYWHQCADVLRR